MPHSHGYRARTRHLFARKFREHGMIKLSTYMNTYKVGDLVDIHANGAVQKGMPFKFYHGYKNCSRNHSFVRLQKDWCRLQCLSPCPRNHCEQAGR